MYFDARSAKSLPAGSHVTIEGCPGLRLVATDSRKSWVYRFKSPVDGRMRQIKIGSWPAQSLPGAIADWERLRVLRESGADPAMEKRAARRAEAGILPKDDGYTVRKLCNDYLDGHIDINRKEKGAFEIRRMFRTMLGDLAAVLAEDVTRAQAFDLLERFKGVPVQAANLRAELGAAWDYALDAGRIGENTPNWWRQIMRGKLKSKGKVMGGERVGTTKRTLSDIEVGKLIRWLPHFGPLVSDALALYLWTGTRGAEIVTMEARDVSRENGVLWWTIPKHKTKNVRRENATDLRVPLLGMAEAIVQRRIDSIGEGYLFPGEKSAHIPQKVIGVNVWAHQPYAKARERWDPPRLPVSHWSPHDLRRTVRTMLASMKCPDDVAEAVIGHVQPGIKGVYNRHTYDAERLEWLSKLSDRLTMLSTADDT